MKLMGSAPSRQNACTVQNNGITLLMCNILFMYYKDKIKKCVCVCVCVPLMKPVNDQHSSSNLLTLYVKVEFHLLLFTVAQNVNKSLQILTLLT